jgi:SpoVK/Ycf46/Vps4 family AAA+-type ATPase
VPLVQYRTYFDALRATGRRKVKPEQVREAFSHMVLSERILDEIGPALSSGRAMFIYGAPGNGKSAIASGLRHLLPGIVAVPHALEVQGTIVRVFDRGLHEPLSDDDAEGLAIELDSDRRWVACRRPRVTAGGELTLESLELSFDERLGYCQAPLQLVANGGVLIIDDFGRERCAPRDLLNRWMVPLESGVDFLTLRSGLKFELPFLIFVAFATNVTPSDLVDEAFLRRVHYKILAESPTAEDFARIFENYCEECNLSFDPRLVERLLSGYYARHQTPLRGCHPRDLIDQALRLVEYRDAPRELTDELLETACASYFVQDRR